MQSSAHLISHVRVKAYKLPPAFGNLFNIVDWFHKHSVANGHFRDEHSAEKVRPLSGAGLLKGAALVGAKYAGLGGLGEAWPWEQWETRTTGISGDTVHLRQSHCPSGM